MNFDDIKLLQQRGKELSLPFPIKRRKETKGLISVNDFVPIPIENIASFYNRDINLPLKKEDGTEIGYLYFTKDLVVSVDDIFSFPEPKYICYLIDIPNISIIEEHNSHAFQCDYVVIYRQYIDDYLSNSLNGAPLWGFFNHKYPTLIFSPPTKKIISEIVVGSYQKFAHNYYYEAGVRGIKHSLAFERFLSYYHLLELNFDLDVINRIKLLDTNMDSKSISILLQGYKREDLERLKYLLNTYCTDISMLILRINSITAFLPIAKEIFYDYGKDTNPLKEISDLHKILAKPDGFTLVNCKKIGKGKDADSHRKFICDLCAYWIYRIRNSIAHKKIGEFIMSHNEEAFILEFAEPLLVSILKQVFK